MDIICICEYESPEYSHDRLALAEGQYSLCADFFFGSAFSIMVFNNDVGVHEVFARTYELVTGEEKQWIYGDGDHVFCWDRCGYYRLL